MQEKVSENPGATSVVVQYFPYSGSVGLGLEFEGVVPDQHFIDAMYGDNLVNIGRIFRERISKDRKMDIHEGYRTGNAPDVLDAEIGRMILDAVTGSSEHSSLFTSLGRGSVNRLIRLLRKARDTTFGKDE